MATPQERQERIKEIHERNQKVISLDIEKDLIKKEKLGDDLHLEVLRENFIQILNIAKRIEQCNIDEAPYNYLINYNNTIGDTENLLSQIMQFTASTESPIHQRGRFVTLVQQRIDVLIEHSSPLFIIDLLNGFDLSIEKAKVQSLADEIGREKQNSHQEIEAIKKELRETLESAKRAAAQIGVAQHSQVFQEEANTHRKESVKWLWITISIMILTAVCGALFMFWLPPNNSSTAHVIQFTITKVIVLAVLFYALSISVKNYRAHKHNTILNKHRQNALRTFETFVKGSSDEQTKNAILLQTSHAIFANQQTGYVSNENDGDMPGKIIEIIKSSSSKSQ